MNMFMHALLAICRHFALVLSGAALAQRPAMACGARAHMSCRGMRRPPEPPTTACSSLFVLLITHFSPISLGSFQPLLSDVPLGIHPRPPGCIHRVGSVY